MEPISTDVLRQMTGLSKSGITTFEQQNIIRRVAPNTWPMPDTMVALVTLVTYLRTRKPAISDDHSRWEKARALREELRIQRESHQLVRLSDFQEAVDSMAFVVLKHLAPLPSRLGGRDLAERKRVDAELRLMQSAMCDELKATGWARPGKPHDGCQPARPRALSRPNRDRGARDCVHRSHRHTAA
jgi:hypothetical protein